jgi:hypothetical protein
VAHVLLALVLDIKFAEEYITFILRHFIDMTFRQKSLQVVRLATKYTQPWKSTLAEEHIMIPVQSLPLCPSLPVTYTLSKVSYVFAPIVFPLGLLI